MANIVAEKKVKCECNEVKRNKFPFFICLTAIAGSKKDFFLPFLFVENTLQIYNIVFYCIHLLTKNTTTVSTPVTNLPESD